MCGQCINTHSLYNEKISSFFPKVKLHEVKPDFTLNVENEHVKLK